MVISTGISSRVSGIGYRVSELPDTRYPTPDTRPFLPITNVPRRRDDSIDARHHRLFQEVVERHRDLVAVDVLDRRIEIIEQWLLNLLEDSSAHSAVAVVLVDD